MFTSTLLVVNMKGEQCFYLSSAYFGGNKKKIGGTSRGSPLYLTTTLDLHALSIAIGVEDSHRPQRLVRITGLRANFYLKVLESSTLLP